MTKQEQIEEIKQVLIKTCKRCRSFEEDYMQSKYAEALYNAGYGNVSEYKAERELLGSQIKVLKQRLNNKYIEVDNLNRDYHNSFERLKAQEREIMRLKDENAKLQEQFAKYQLASGKEILAQVKQAQIEEIAKFDKLCYDYNKLLYIIRCNMTSITRYVRNKNEEYDARYKELAEKAVENILTTINHRGEE